ncbi:hypothetical protein [Flavobacterium sp. WC2429]|uniref:Uncharacterized protein n=1 Tax=Flavobacterium sp. WC2429 TaxID=3234140 RepID=A0AB39WNQ7_9FLAO
MSTKVLLNENQAQADSKIHFLNLDYQRGKKMLETLKKIGFEAGSITDWQEVEKHFYTNPDWTLEFNLQAKGYSETFAEAKKLFSSQNRYEAITDAEKEEIKEQYRIYASDHQKEALQLVNSIADNLNRLKDFNIPINSSYASQLCYVLRNKDQNVTVSNESLLPYLLKLEQDIFN